MAGRLRVAERLARHTSLRVGGPADALALVDSTAELVRVLQSCEAHDEPTHVLGAGFNTLAPDEGLRAVVIRLSGLRTLARAGDGGLVAEAGASHASVSRFCADQGLAGLEFAAGIPGTVGGWIAMNAGVPGREMCDVIESVSLLPPGASRPREVSAPDLAFRYRALDLPPGSVVVAARFRLDPCPSDEIRERVRSLLTERRRRQPVDRLSCGSVFKNPPDDHAGRLIESAGLKGLRHGGAGISSLHANFIVNNGGATTADVLWLIDRARSEVASRFGIELEPEVRMLGVAP